MMGIGLWMSILLKVGIQPFKGITCYNVFMLDGAFTFFINCSTPLESSFALMNIWLGKISILLFFKISV